MYYRISDSTHIAKVPLKRLLSHTKTKIELAAYLAQKVKLYAGQSGKQLVVASVKQRTKTWGISKVTR